MNFFKKNKRELIWGSVVALILVIIIQKFFVIATIPSESMEKTILKGDRVFIKTINVQIERDKIYTFTKDNTYLIKRCIGIGGDHIQIKGDKVIRNGVELQEDYVSSKVASHESDLDIDIIVPEGKVFFLGDNRRVSNDARFWKDRFVPEENILGVATYIIFPFTRVGNVG